MQMVKASAKGKIEKRRRLGELKPGELFRFPSVSYEEALSGAEEAGFFLVVKTVPEKKDRVTIAAIDGKLLLERDADREVVVHAAVIEIQEAEYE